ncbi:MULTISPECIES: hypothetical protein [unclassified Sinorhizobium]|uniref:hypothetical protein n=1 Tax=unclassified Sinorhizobium TaxID=2613772 RepID=UPI0035263E94
MKWGSKKGQFGENKGMNDRAEVVEWLSRLEALLQERGLLDGKGELVSESGARLAVDIEDLLDGFVENIGELNGLLKIGRAARGGEPLSAAVLGAARLMIREVFLALQGDTTTIAGKMSSSGDEPN